MSVFRKIYKKIKNKLKILVKEIIQIVIKKAFNLFGVTKKNKKLNSNKQN